MIIIIVVALVLIAAACLCLNCGPGCGTNMPSTSDTTTNTGNVTEEGCSESSCSSNCSSDKTAIAESTTCSGCGENSCTKSCSTNPANDTTDLKSLVPSCNLSNDQLHERKQELKNSIVQHINRVEELEMGYDFIFVEPADYSIELLEFINFERGCCSSFTYALIFEPNNKATHLQIYGSAAIKEELRLGFGELGLVNM
jgi:hypothetical protein